MVEKKLIDKVESIRTTLNEISVYNLDVKTSLELYYELARKVNEVITELTRFEGVVSEEVVKQNEKLLYLLGEGLKEQVGIKIDELITNGTIQDLINNKIFSDLNTKIETFKQQTDEQFNTIELEKADKNTVWSMENMGQDVKEAMTNGSVAVVGENSVLRDDIVEKQVTFSKTNFLTAKKNMINPNELTGGYYINASGYKVADINYSITNKIWLIKGVDYFVTDYRFVTVYKSDGTVVENEGKSIAGSGIVNLTEGDYIIITFQTSKIGVTAQLEKGSMRTSYEKFIYKLTHDLYIKDDYITPEMASFLQKSKNLIDISKSESGFIGSYNATKLTTSSSYKTTEFIEVPTNTNISISPKVRKLCLYNEKNLSKGDQATFVGDTTENLTINTGNFKYVRISYFVTDEDKIQLEISNSVTEYENYGYNLIGVNTPKQDLSHLEINPLVGKTLGNFGDSIADGVSASYKSYAHRIAEKYRMTIHDYANGGATIKVTDGNTNNILNQINNAEATTLDYILFNGYTNDCYPATNVTDESYVGVITEGYNDTYDINTFCGAFEQILKTLQEKYEGAKIVYVSTHINDSRDLKSQKIFNELALRICKKWGVMVANMFEEGGLNSLLTVHKTKYINDGSHPNALGYDEKYVPLVESKMKSV